MESELIEISNLDFEKETFNDFSDSSSLKSSNFGGGIELLMNDKQKMKESKSTDIDIEELDILENELNDLANNNFNEPLLKNNDFNKKNISIDPQYDKSKQNVHFQESGIGKSTAQYDPEEKTWDGYAKFNDIPINPDAYASSQPTMTKEELLREKLKYLRKLESLEKKGIELTKKYNMDSPLAEMQGEYEMIMDEKSKQNSVKFQGNMLMAAINGIEFLNGRFDPFDIKLDGWGEQINENINDYDDIFGELHEKYKSKASLAPELKLLFQLGGSAMMVHMTNTMFKTAMPGMDDILRQNPDLMKSFQNAAVNSMSQTNPGFSGFMSNMMNTGQEFSNSSGSGPPPPMATQGPNSIPHPLSRPGNNNFSNRPDASMARGVFANQNDGINIRENKSSQETMQKSLRSSRPEMQGPSDIDGILSGLKTKKINIQQSVQPSSPRTNESSTISINDLKDLQSEGKAPKKSKRRPQSEKNTLSLDI